MSGTVDSPLEIKAALVEAATVALDGQTQPNGLPVVPWYGHPGMHQPDEIVSAGDISWTSAQGPVGNRHVRDIDVRVQLTASVIRRGDEDDRAAELRCHELLDFVSEYVRKEPTLDGLAHWCFETSRTSVGATSPDLLAEGRVIEAVAEFTARCRISS